MANQGNSWRKMLIKSRAPMPSMTSKKTFSSLIKQSEVQEQKRLATKNQE